MRRLLARYPTTAAVVLALILFNLTAGSLSEHSYGTPFLTILRLMLAPFALVQTGLIVIFRLVAGSFPNGFPLALRLVLIAAGIVPYFVLDWVLWNARKGKGPK